MTVEFDPGPPRWFAEHFSRVPDYSSRKEDYWYDWGPVFYRGRLDGSARLLCVASDPGPTERVAMRTLVGDAGQRVQGFLRKVGLTRSYLCLNALAYALIPSHSESGKQLLWDPDHIRWRNELFDEVKGPNLQAIAAFGENAQVAVGLWDGKGGLPVFEVPHPSSRDPQRLLDTWREAVEGLRGAVTPDADGDPSTPNYGDVFREEDYARVPLSDLPFGVPGWFGDDSWRRKMGPSTRSSVVRPKDDDRHTLIWYAPWS
jgi:hypothetical protein